jgi:serine/threonine protein kinase
MSLQALALGTRIAGYVITRLVGQGGFGIVYEAVNPITEERVAIKEFFPRQMVSRHGGTIVLHDDRETDIYDKVLRRFGETAALQFRFDHPDILRVRNYIPGDGTGYMITEFVDGEPLERYLQQSGGAFRDAARFRAVMEPIVGAVGYIHRKGHLHRDISPDNVMVRTSGEPVLIDFGALKRDASRTTSVSVIFAREAYSPREQQDQSAPEGFYTDIFALAGTMYFGLAGKPPISANERAGQIITARKDPYVPAAEASRVDCAPEVFAAIDRALRLPPMDRPQTIEQFAAELGWTPDFGDAGEASDVTKLVIPSAIEAAPAPSTSATSNGSGLHPSAQPSADPPGGGSDAIADDPAGQGRKWKRIAAAAAVLLIAGGVSLAFFGLDRLDPGPTPDGCGTQEAFDKVPKTDLSALTQYEARCKSGPFAASARAAIASIRDNNAYAAAQACVQSAQSCSLDACASPYTREFSAHATELATAVNDRRKALGCDVPARQAYCAQRNNFDQVSKTDLFALNQYEEDCKNGPFGAEARAAIRAIRENNAYATALECVRGTQGCNLDRCVADYTNLFNDRVAAIREQVEARRRAQSCDQPRDSCQQEATFKEAVNGGLAALRSFLDRCRVSTYRPQAEVEIRKIEQDSYLAAQQCIQSESSCRFDACLRRYDFTDRSSDLQALARRELNSPRCEQTTPFCDQQTAYDNAVRGGLPELRSYLSRCQTGTFANRAEGQIRTLETNAYNDALRCIQGTCSANTCVQRFGSSVGDKITDLRSAAAAAENEARCQALPNGTYSGERGYSRPVDRSSCPPLEPVTDIQISNGTITMVAAGFRWRGTVNQKTGTINIADSGVTDLSTGQRSRRGLSISGDYRSATLSSGLCGPGFFRIRK